MRARGMLRRDATPTTYSLCGGAGEAAARESGEGARSVNESALLASESLGMRHHVLVFLSGEPRKDAALTDASVALAERARGRAALVRVCAARRDLRELILGDDASASVAVIELGLVMHTFVAPASLSTLPSWVDDVLAGSVQPSLGARDRAQLVALYRLLGKDAALALSPSR